MKLVITFFILLIAVSIVYKLYVYNDLSDGNMQGYSYTRYNWTFDHSQANDIIKYWKSDPAKTSVIKKLILYDFIFIIFYVIGICHISYTLMQQQNRLWLNIWLRMGIFSVFIGAVLNIVQGYFNTLSIETGNAYFFAIALTIVKWIFISLAIIPILISWLLKPLQTSLHMK